MCAGLASILSDVPRKRRVFFSFHYGPDIWRVNQVRNSWRYQHQNDREAMGFFDGSLWERSKRTGDESLKALIREGMENTSVTCVLAGAETYVRRWVRYEIARSVVKGNGLLTVHIHRLQNNSRLTSFAGPDPLDYMGVYKVPDGRILLAACSPGGQWERYGDYTRALNLPNNWIAPISNTVVPLSRYVRRYDYVRDRGMQNFASWIAQAAREVNR